MDIQLLVNATSGRPAPGGSKAQGPGGDFANDLSRAAQARQSIPGDASLSSTEKPIQPVSRSPQPSPAASPGKLAHPALRGPDVVRHDIPLPGLAGPGEGAPPGVLSSLGSDATSHHRSLYATLPSLSEGEVKDVLMTLKEKADLPNGDAWDAIQKRLDLIDQAVHLDASEEYGSLPMALQADAIRPELGSPREAGQEPRSNALLQAFAIDTLERKGLRQSQLTQLEQTAERPGGLEAVSSRSASPIDEPKARIALANDSLMAPRSDTPGSTDSFELGSRQGLPVSTASATPTSAQGAIQAPVSSPAWPQQLGQQLVRLSQNGVEQRVELQLHPAELGPLTVSLKVGDQGAQAQFLSAHAPVRQALEQAIPQLREALAEQGISLGETSVGEQHNGNRDTPPQHSGDMLASAGAGESDEGARGSSDTGGTHELSLDGRVDLYA